MLDNSGPEFASMRHVKTGIVGAGGELPAGWAPEQFSEVEILALDQSERGPGIKLKLTFAAEIEGDFVSLAVGPFRAGKPDDVFVLSTFLKLEGAENIGAGFAIIREWQVNGPFVSQSTREFSLGENGTRVLSGLQLKQHQRALQPVIAFRRKTRDGGQCTLTLRRTALANLYECPGWLSP